MTASAADLVRVASGQVNYVESGGRDGKSGNITKFGAAYGLNGYAWCSIFVWWCFHQLGIDVRHVVSGNYAGAEQAMEGFAKHGWKISKSAGRPRLGDVVFFHFDGEHSGANHTGIVVGADAGGVHTIEGNTSSGNSGSQVNGGGVYRRYRPYSVIIGYGRYPFPTAAPAAPRIVPVVGKKYPLLKEGSTGEPVRRLEALLHIPVDAVGHGVYGPQCKKAVGAYQKAHGLYVDYEAGPVVLSRLGY